VDLMFKACGRQHTAKGIGINVLPVGWMEEHDCGTFCAGGPSLQPDGIDAITEGACAVYLSSPGRPLSS